MIEISIPILIPIALLIFTAGYVFGLWTAGKVNDGEDEDEDEDEYPLDVDDPYMSSLYKGHKTYKGGEK